MEKKLDRESLTEKLQNITIPNKDAVISFLLLYRHGEYVYHDVLRRNIRVTPLTADEIISCLIEAQILSPTFQYYCMNCSRPVGTFRTEEETDDVYCDCCGEEISKINKYYSYRVI